MKQRVRTSSSHCLSDATGMMHSMVLPNPGCPGVARQSVILRVIVSRSSSRKVQQPQLQCCCRKESTRFFSARRVSSPALRVPRLCWPGCVICRRWYVGLLPFSLEFCSWSCHFSHGSHHYVDHFPKFSGRHWTATGGVELRVELYYCICMPAITCGRKQAIHISRGQSGKDRQSRR